MDTIIQDMSVLTSEVKDEYKRERERENDPF